MVVLIVINYEDTESLNDDASWDYEERAVFIKTLIVPMA